VKKFPGKNWSVRTVHRICQEIQGKPAGSRGVEGLSRVPPLDFEIFSKFVLEIASPDKDSSHSSFLAHLW
jgi:hypothetical protein